jgi:hypothetical protein
VPKRVLEKTLRSPPRAATLGGGKVTSQNLRPFPPRGSEWRTIHFPEGRDYCDDYKVVAYPTTLSVAGKRVESAEKLGRDHTAIVLKDNETFVSTKYLAKISYSKFKWKNLDIPRTKKGLTFRRGFDKLFNSVNKLIDCHITQTSFPKRDLDGLMRQLYSLNDRLPRADPTLKNRISFYTRILKSLCRETYAN